MGRCMGQGCLKQKFIDFYFNVAEQTAKLSHAVRLKVGAVVVKDNNILSFGYNGMPAGMPNDCEDVEYVDEDGQDYDEMVSKGYTFGAVSDVAGYSRRVTKPEVIHAEANAIAKLARQNGSGQDATMFITHAPCVECAKLIVQSGIKTVYWKSQYRDRTGLELLNNAGILTYQEKE